MYVIITCFILFHWRMISCIISSNKCRRQQDRGSNVPKALARHILMVFLFLLSVLDFKLILHNY